MIIYLRTHIGTFNGLPIRLRMSDYGRSPRRAARAAEICVAPGVAPIAQTRRISLSVALLTCNRLCHADPDGIFPMYILSPERRIRRLITFLTVLAVRGVIRSLIWCV